MQIEIYHFRVSWSVPARSAAANKRGNTTVLGFRNVSLQLLSPEPTSHTALA